jgi:glycosyltransferase involved in cell wall biosynthesis
VAAGCSTPVSPADSSRRVGPGTADVNERDLAMRDLEVIPADEERPVPTPAGLDGTEPGEIREPHVEVIGRPDKPRISVVMPALNEAQNLLQVLPCIPDTVWEVILVDGGSLDGTVEVFNSLRPDGVALTHERPGKGNALAAGFAACRGDIVVMLDADGSANPEEIPKFVQALLAGADFAKGTRFAKDGGSDDITTFRRLGNRVLVGLVNLLYRTQYTDLCYGMNAFWRHCLPYISPDCDGFEVETFMNLRLAKASLRVHEVGSYERRRLYGVSKLHTVRDGCRVLWTIVRLRFTGIPAAGDASVETHEESPA